MSSPIQLLSRYGSQSSTGYLYIHNNSITWKIYLQQGKVKYVDCSLQLLIQLKYYLYHQGQQASLELLKNIPQEEFKSISESNQGTVKLTNTLYEKIISWLYLEKHLDDSQIVSLVEYISQDFLESCLWIAEAQCSWHEEGAIPVWLQTSMRYSLSLDLPDLLQFLQQRLKVWQTCTSAIFSPHQRPYFLNYRDIEKTSSSNTLSPTLLKKLAQIMLRGLSFRQLSICLNRDELHVAQILSPYIEQKIIYLRNPETPLERLPTIPKPNEIDVNNLSEEKTDIKKRKIVCIDDSPTILQEIERFLQHLPFSITTINDPVQASSVIFRLEPDLILLDITMPRINGYKLCSLLRSSQVFDRTPIIMVTGNTGLIDQAKAKIAGATDYLTKPFTQQALMKIVDKYLN
jgi:twitching motility two-component system response regulator PilG